MGLTARIVHQDTSRDGVLYANGIDNKDPFWDLVHATEDGCWEWMGVRNDAGYGQYRNEGAHRRAFQKFYRKYPGRLLVCHHCDNPPCVRPHHLFLGTIADNNRDRDTKGRHRAAFGEDHGNSRLSTDDIATIRARLTTGGKGTGSQLAREYGVTRANISLIKLGRGWAKV